MPKAECRMPNAEEEQTYPCKSVKSVARGNPWFAVISEIHGPELKCQLFCGRLAALAGHVQTAVRHRRPPTPLER
jgi:hypothetical protein